ncbi:UPF0223 family protein [Pontibacillus salicampi]|uniref:UPF0223 family protein n=1 Tax=Pontibacillus salicampi TaxID=1449801 RepID=A0ABV6LNW5_9BACI
MSEENKYTYPIDTEYWTTEEIVDVIHFYEQVEKAYEQGLKREDLMTAYSRFKEIVPSKSEEKKLGKQLEESSGYSLYKAVKEAQKQSDGEQVKL